MQEDWRGQIIDLHLLVTSCDVRNSLGESAFIAFILSLKYSYQDINQGFNLQ